MTSSSDSGSTQLAPESAPGSQSGPGSPVVAVVATTPETAVADMGRAMHLAGVDD